MSIYFDEWEHKKELYLRYKDRYGENEIAKRLGLKPFEHEHFKKLFEKTWTEPKKSN